MLWFLGHPDTIAAFLRIELFNLRFAIHSSLFKVQSSVALHCCRRERKHKKEHRDRRHGSTRLAKGIGMGTAAVLFALGFVRVAQWPLGMLVQAHLTRLPRLKFPKVSPQQSTAALGDTSTKFPRFFCLCVFLLRCACFFCSQV